MPSRAGTVTRVSSHFAPPQVRQGGQGAAVSRPPFHSGSDIRFWLSLSAWTADLCHGECSGCVSSWLLPPSSARAKRCLGPSDFRGQAASSVH